MHSTITRVHGLLVVVQLVQRPGRAPSTWHVSAGPGAVAARVVTAART